ncbi:MAG TPA: tripartite tricarboxylate transporter substrate binding protein [Burkholderiales bacterium]|nr:tripartite tricarboxylate transporter substrate binding protein [Burkholderiales bacterium]
MIRATLIIAHLAFGAAVAHAAVPPEFPNRPVRYVVGGSVGGAADSLARAIAQKLSEQWSQPVVIDNRAGGGGIVASDIVAKSPPDGHTLLMAFTSHATNPSLYPKLSYDTLKDFAPVTLVATGANVLVVHPSVRAKNVSELVALAKTKQLSFASTGSGASTHLAGVLFGYVAGVKLLHVPYKGAGPALAGIVSGETDMSFPTMVSILPQVKSGKVRALGVTGARRSAAAPELPTIAEAGVPGYEANAWYATYVAAGTPPPLIARLNSAIVGILNTPDVKQRLAALGVEPSTTTPEELGRYTRSELQRWNKVIRETGAKAD